MVWRPVKIGVSATVVLSSFSQGAQTGYSWRQDASWRPHDRGKETRPMARISEILSPTDLPEGADEKTRADMARFFKRLFPEGPVGAPHAGYSILAQSPGVAVGILDLADQIIYGTMLNERRDLRELAIQTLNLKFKYDFSFHAHLTIAQAHGVSLEQQAALPYWRTSKLFDDEQKLVIAFTEACTSDDVPADLFARVVERYGERGALELTIGIAWWVFWGIILNATAPEFEPERARPLPKDAAAELGDEQE
jgi:4-carboxymuconolactone decarboxylase